VVSGAPRAAVRPQPSRRTLLAAVGGTAAVALAGCGGSKSVRQLLQTAPLEIKHSEAGLLAMLLDLEYKAVAAYTAGITLLSPENVPIGKQFLRHELTHAGAMYSLLKQAGGKGFRAAPSYPLGNPSTSDEVLGLLHQVEQEQLAGYLYAIPRLTPGPVRAAVARYFAADAQHTSVLRAQLGLAAVPSPFIDGNE
jgi:hypothetical protein